MNFDLLNLTSPKKKSRNTTKSHDIFTIPLFLAMVGPSLIYIYIYIYNFRVILHPQYFHNKS